MTMQGNASSREH